MGWPGVVDSKGPNPYAVGETLPVVCRVHRGSGSTPTTAGAPDRCWLRRGALDRHPPPTPRTWRTQRDRRPRRSVHQGRFEDHDPAGRPSHLDSLMAFYRRGSSPTRCWPGQGRRLAGRSGSCQVSAPRVRRSRRMSTKAGTNRQANKMRPIIRKSATSPPPPGPWDHFTLRLSRTLMGGMPAPLWHICSGSDALPVQREVTDWRRTEPCHQPQGQRAPPRPCSPHDMTERNRHYPPGRIPV